MRDTNVPYRAVQPSSLAALNPDPLSLVTGHLDACTDIQNLIFTEGRLSQRSEELAIDAAHRLKLTATPNITHDDAKTLLRAYCKGRRYSAKHYSIYSPFDSSFYSPF